MPLKLMMKKENMKDKKRITKLVCTPAFAR